MKNNEIALLIVIASMSVLVAYFVADNVIKSPSSTSEKVQIASPITANVQTPDKTIFNKDAINPTVEVVIGDDK